MVVAARAGAAPEALLDPELDAAVAPRRTNDPATLRRSPGGQVLVLRQPLHPGSATDVRERIATDRPWRHLLAPAVADYIAAHHLYGSGTAAGAGRPAPL